MAASRRLFNHLVGAAEQYERKADTKRLGGLEVQEQLDLRGLLDWQVAGVFAFEYAAGVDPGHAIGILRVATVTDQAAGRGERATLEDRGHRVAERQRGEPFGLADEESIGADHERLGLQLGDSCKERIEVAFVT